eukprot:s275_g8.t1
MGSVCHDMDPMELAAPTGPMARHSLHELLLRDTVQLVRVQPDGPQRSAELKLDTHYNSRGRPPLLEAFFLMRLHQDLFDAASMTRCRGVSLQDYKQGLVDADCPNPLILALLLVSEVQLQAPPWYDLDRAFALLRNPGDDVMYDFAQAISEEGRSLHDVGLRLAKEASPFQQHLMASAPAAWPLRKALKRVQAAQDRLSDAVPLIAQAVLGGHAPSACSRLFLYEKCGAWTDPSSFAAGPFQAVRVIARPDIGAARGDECSAYLTHILANYQKLADFIVFLQSDPMDHLHMDFLDLVLRSIAAGTYDVGFLPLNGPRHVRTLTPCLQAVHEEIFGENLTALVGPYCCAQFAVSRETVQQRSLELCNALR